MTGPTLRTNQPHDVKAAAAQAAQLVAQRLTCEGCSALRGVRPMCQSEASPHYRQPRHAGNDRCGVWAPVKAQQGRAA